MDRTVILGAAVGLLSASAGMAWAVRGRSSQVFGPTVWRGDRRVRAVALTFDDGPSSGTPELLDVLSEYGVSATFFACGEHVRRHAAVACDAIHRGHEIGNHTNTHASLWLRSQDFLRQEIGIAQHAIEESTGVRPRLFRPTYGVRWFGLGAVLREFGLTSVTWTTIGRDWALGGRDIADRLMRGASNGAILCLHDGRERAPRPDISSTVEAVRRVVPQLLDAGYQFRTVSELIGYSSAVCPTRS